MRERIVLVLVTFDREQAMALGARFTGEALDDRVQVIATDEVFAGDLTLADETQTVTMVVPEGSNVLDSVAGASVIGRETEDVWVPLGRSDWIIGETLSTPIVADVPEAVQESMREDRRWLAALWLLGNQVNVVDRVTQAPDRPARRRSQRAKVDPTVTVVRLRRLREPSEHDDETPGPGREWKHRWIVGGHWRKQPYGPGRSLRRPVWIAPYVKGPEGKPLVARPKVKALVR